MEQHNYDISWPVFFWSKFDHEILQPFQHMCRIDEMGIHIRASWLAMQFSWKSACHTP